MEKSLHIVVEKCTGCMQCEMACSFEKEQVFNPARSRIKVFHFHDEAKNVQRLGASRPVLWMLLLQMKIPMPK